MNNNIKNLNIEIEEKIIQLERKTENIEKNIERIKKYEEIQQKIKEINWSLISKILKLQKILGSKFIKKTGKNDYFSTSKDKKGNFYSRGKTFEHFKLEDLNPIVLPEAQKLGLLLMLKTKNLKIQNNPNGGHILTGFLVLEIYDTISKKRIKFETFGAVSDKLQIAHLISKFISYFGRYLYIMIFGLFVNEVEIEDISSKESLRQVNEKLKEEKNTIKKVKKTDQNILKEEKEEKKEEENKNDITEFDDWED